MDIALYEAETAIRQAQLQNDLSLHKRLQRISDALADLRLAVRKNLTDAKP